LILHATSVGDSLLVIALVHKQTNAWLTSAQILRNQEIMDADLNEVLSELQNEIANELNSRYVPATEVAAP
jgi:hypothetical protein